ncbi:MAG: Uma2 family endonuclease [Chloroflexota bacterium]
MIQPTRTRVRATDYYQLPEYADHDLIQLIDGEVIVSMPPIPKHQDIAGEIFYLFKTIARQSGARTFFSPIEVVLDEHNVFEPDVLYLKPDSACTVGEKRLSGAPDLVVEVLSPGTAKYDRQQKYEAYERHGVGEYWIVDPLHDIIEVWTLGEDGLFKRQGAYAGDDTFKSVTLNEDVSVKAIFNG